MIGLSAIKMTVGNSKKVRNPLHGINFFNLGICFHLDFFSLLVMRVILPEEFLPRCCLHFSSCSML